MENNLLSIVLLLTNDTVVAIFHGSKRQNPLRSTHLFFSNLLGGFLGLWLGFGGLGNLSLDIGVLSLSSLLGGLGILGVIGRDFDTEFGSLDGDTSHALGVERSSGLVEEEGLDFLEGSIEVVLGKTADLLSGGDKSGRGGERKGRTSDGVGSCERVDAGHRGGESDSSNNFHFDVCVVFAKKDIVSQVIDNCESCVEIENSATSAQLSIILF